MAKANPSWSISAISRSWRHPAATEGMLPGWQRVLEQRGGRNESASGAKCGTDSALARTRLRGAISARLRTSGSKKPAEPACSRLAPEIPGSGYAAGLTAIAIDLGI